VNGETGERVSTRSPRINESNLLTGLLNMVEPAQGITEEIALFIVDLANPGPVEPVFYFTPGEWTLPLDIPPFSPPLSDPINTPPDARPLNTMRPLQTVAAIPCPA
jgi:hypothetical protein